MGGRFLADVCAETAKLAIPTNMEGLDLRFGGARTDEEHLAAAAMPLLMEFFTDGGLDVPLLRRMRWKG
jgi:hypothetical protein